MNKKLGKNLEKARRKKLVEKYEQTHPHYTEGIWEDNMLENNSFVKLELIY